MKTINYISMALVSLLVSGCSRKPSDRYELYTHHIPQGASFCILPENESPLADVTSEKIAGYLKDRSYKEGALDSADCLVTFDCGIDRCDEKGLFEKYLAITVYDAEPQHHLNQKKQIWHARSSRTGVSPDFCASHLIESALEDFGRDPNSDRDGRWDL